MKPLEDLQKWLPWETKLQVFQPCFKASCIDCCLRLYAGKIPLRFRWEEFHLPNARAETVCSLRSDVSSRRSLHRHCGANRIISIAGGIFPNGAADETRTRNIHLGRVALYQLNYCRINKMPFAIGINPLIEFGRLYLRAHSRMNAAGIFKNQDAVDQFSRLFLIAACVFTALREGIEPSSDG